MKIMLLMAVLALFSGSREQVDGDKDRLSEMKDMQLIKGRAFQMGDVFDEGVQLATPVQEVILSSFYLNRYEVTIEEFTSFVKEMKYVTSAEKESKGTANPDDEYSSRLASHGAWVLDPEKGSSWVAGANWKNPQYEQSSKDPVTCVSWGDAVSYCNWLSKKEGLAEAYEVKTGNLLDAEGRPTTNVTKARGYRLPTEAEWEFAAREQGRKIRFGNGQNVARSSEMNFNAAEGEFAYAEKGHFRKKTIPVGSFTPNALGLHDMSGNVWEWCSDFMGQYTKEPKTDPYQGEGVMGPRRAARGGPWIGDASFARVATRMGWVADDRCNNIGFRIARSK
jgi:formylglycine-generating enzyme required for sulfatase activity